MCLLSSLISIEEGMCHRGCPKVTVVTPSALHRVTCEKDIFSHQQPMTDINSEEINVFLLSSKKIK